ncbi:MAG: serine hydrolase [Candidatus Lokiarchaeota archaeon]|nr:serine hydrolase [Candidatus Lokiarchaeota archaeon]MBD3339927.1 serine hydrolase [Candidatus Lokiarchaeota archaeon]
MVNIRVNILKRIIDKELVRSKPPGLALGVFNKEETIFGEGYGVYDLSKGENAPVNLDTTFMLGSITKLFTIILLMQFWEKGKFSLDDAVNDFLPHGKIIIKKGWPEITFRHILTHTAGIGELRHFKDIFKSGFRLITYEDGEIPPLSSLHDLPVYPSSPAGLKYAYSNIGISMMGYLVEKWSGQDFRQIIIERIFDPIGMNRSDLIRSKRIQPNEALGYKYKKGNLIRAKRWNNIIKPSGALVSSINDMIKFGQVLLNKGKYPRGRLLKPKTFDLMLEPHYFAHEKLKDLFALGLVFRLYNMNGMRIIGHTGGVSGFNSAFSLLPEENLGLCISCNLGESLKSRTSLRIRNRFLKVLTKIENNYRPPKEFKKKYWKKIAGHYGGYPGFLTNTRLITQGIEFEISQKEDYLTLNRFTSPFRKSEILYPTRDPLIFEISRKNGQHLYPTERYVFRNDQKDNIIELCRGFEKLRKLKIYERVDFKIFLSIILLLLGSIIILFVLLIFS